MTEGKVPLTFQAYNYLARRALAMTADFPLAMFAHLFLLLCWNLIARSVSVSSLMFNHISWEEDAMCSCFQPSASRPHHCWRRASLRVVQLEWPAAQRSHGLPLPLVRTKLPHHRAPSNNAILPLQLRRGQDLGLVVGWRSAPAAPLRTVPQPLPQVRPGLRSPLLMSLL